MRRGYRILLEIAGPPAIAAVLFWLVMVVASVANGEWVPPEALPIFLFFAYMFAILPALAFAIAMEVLFARGLDPASPRTLLASAALGALAGVAVDLTMQWGNWREWKNLPFYVGLGLLTGAIVGAWIWLRSRAVRRRAAQGGAGAVSSRASAN